MVLIKRGNGELLSVLDEKEVAVDEKKVKAAIKDTMEVKKQAEELTDKEK